MLTGFYSAASGMLMQQRVIDSISNNIVNAKTPGAKTERVVSTTFQQKLMQRIEAGNNQVLGTTTPTRIVENIMSKYDQSFLEETGRPFDMALDGDGFFVVNTAQDGAEPNEYYTRNGNFDIDDTGYLVLRGVGRVQGENGDIYLGSSSFEVLQDGTIYDANNRAVDKLKLRTPATPQDIKRGENGLFKSSNPDAATLPNAYLRQGLIERSNVDLNREYTAIMESQRAFQSCSAALKMLDTLNQKTATQIGSL